MRRIATEQSPPDVDTNSVLQLVRAKRVTTIVLDMDAETLWGPVLASGTPQDAGGTLIYRLRGAAPQNTVRHQRAALTATRRIRSPRRRPQESGTTGTVRQVDGLREGLESFVALVDGAMTMVTDARLPGGDIHRDQALPLVCVYSTTVTPVPDTPVVLVHALARLTETRSARRLDGRRSAGMVVGSPPA